MVRVKALPAESVARMSTVFGARGFKAPVVGTLQLTVDRFIVPVALLNPPPLIWYSTRLTMTPSVAVLEIAPGGGVAAGSVEDDVRKVGAVVGLRNAIDGGVWSKVTVIVALGLEKLPAPSTARTVTVWGPATSGMLAFHP